MTSAWLLEPSLKGFLTTMSLIVAIGAQNTFVLTQSIRRQYHMTISALCIVMDLILISAGVIFATYLASLENGNWQEWMKWLGAAFLIGYGTLSFRSALTSRALEDSDEIISSRKMAILTTLAVTLLNPHAYLDTMVLIGSVGAQYADGGTALFIAGACLASLIWFVGLCVGGSLLQPYFRSPATWRMLDIFIGCTMYIIAFWLITR